MYNIIYIPKHLHKISWTFLSSPFLPPVPQLPRFAFWHLTVLSHGFHHQIFVSLGNAVHVVQVSIAGAEGKFGNLVQHLPELVAELQEELN
jgi:hypothetical protein